MVKISDTNPLKGYGNIKKKLKANSSSGTAFADVLSAASNSDGPAAVSSVSATASVGSLLSLQEVSDEDIARKKTIEHGQNLIKSLEALRQSLLMGSVPLHVLQSLEGRLKQQREMTIDPELHAIMDDIELRAAVELAKYERRNDKGLV